MSNSVYNLDMANLEYIQKLIGSAVDNMRLAKSKAYEAYDFIARDNRLLNSYSKKYNLSLYSKFSADSTTTSSITSILTPCIEDCESVIAAFDYFKNIDETGAVSEELGTINTETTEAAEAVDTNQSGETISDVTGAEVKEEVKTKWYQDEGYKEAWEKIKNFEVFEGIGQALGTLLDQVASTIAAVFTSLLNGIVALGEGLVDAAVYLVGGVVSLGAWLFSGKEARDKILDGVKRFVGYDAAGSLYDWWYSTKAGQHVAKKSFMDVNGTAATVLKNTGKWAGIIAISIVGTPAAGAIVAGVSGFGSGAQTAVQGGAGYWGGFAAGTVKGVVDGIMAYNIGSFASSVTHGGLIHQFIGNSGSVFKAQFTTAGSKFAAAFPKGSIGAKIVNKVGSLISKLHPVTTTALVPYTGGAAATGFSTIFASLGPVASAIALGSAATVQPAIVDTLIDNGIEAIFSGNQDSTNPTPNNPTPIDPTPSDPTPSDPTPSDPTPSDPTPSDPTPSDPTPSDPTPSDPTPSDPSTGDDNGEGDKDSGSIEVEPGDGTDSDDENDSSEEGSDDDSSDDTEENPEDSEDEEKDSEEEKEDDEDASEPPKDTEDDEDVSESPKDTEDEIISGKEELEGNIGPGYSVPEDYVENNSSSSSGSSSGGTTGSSGGSTGATDNVETPTGGTSTQLGSIEVTTDNVGSGIEVGESESGLFTYNDHISGTAFLDEITDDAVIGEGSSIIEGMDGIGHIDVTTTDYDHEAYEKARTSYENLGTEWHSKQENIIVNEVDELFVTDQATLGEKLLAYGYSQDEVDTILQDKDIAYRAMIAGYDNSNIEKIRENFSQTPELADSIDVTTIIE